LCHYGLSSGAATPLTFFIADCESDGGRRGQAESDQKLGQKEVDNAFNHTTKPRGAFNSKTG
jgi:hypothetical protein